jgi:protein arginine N-methyltransferase 1
MAKHAESVMKANGVDGIVTVIQGAVEEIELPIEEDGLEADGSPTQVVDIIISEWMGYFLLRESMLDSLIRARDKFLKPTTGLMFPSHTTMYFAPVFDEEERKASAQEYANAMSDWHEFAETTKAAYGVDMNVLESDYEREQKEYYCLSSRWSELRPEAVLAEPAMVKHLDMITCTIDDSRGILAGAPNCMFDFEIDGTEVSGSVSGFAGWFTADFKSRTDDVGRDVAPKLPHPAFLSTGPENGYTHWGQQTFHLVSSIPLFPGQITRISGSLEMTRTKENSRLYNCRITYSSSRRNSDEPADGQYLMKSQDIMEVYQIP